MLVSGGDSRVGGSGPEPSVDVDRLQVLSVTALALEVAFPAGRVDGANIIWKGND